jgi:dihydroxyacetone kinase-like protein
MSVASLESFTAWIDDYAAVVGEQAEHLTDLDRAIGDGDHGSNMARGMSKVGALAGTEEFTAIDAYLKKVGMTLVSTVGGASGPLYGTFFLRMAGPLAGVDEVGPAELGAALRAGVEGIVARGKAELEDKTMYDAWAPALDAFDSSAAGGADMGAALAAAAEAAAKGRESTLDMIARKGRASYLGERSRGHIDPGAASTTMLIESAARTLA